MIIVKLWGGMCNQMFQYAFGFVMAKRHQEELLFDADFYANQPKHVDKRAIMGISQFPNISMMNFTERPSSILFLENKYVSHLIRYNTGCNLNIPFGVHFMMEKLHKFYNDVPYTKKLPNYYDGYWQTSKYFKGYEDEIRHEFEPTNSVLQKVKKWRDTISSKDCVAVHIRRGDYLNTVNRSSLKNCNVIGDSAYYLKAIDTIKEKIDRPVFCFFSDDIIWCRETFAAKIPNAVFVENIGSDAALVDLFSIAACNHGIMSPSTFSWWGNWLRNIEENCIVICPRGDHSNEYFIEDNWIKL